MDSMKYLLLTFYEEGNLYKVAVKFDPEHTNLGSYDIIYFKEPGAQQRLKALWDESSNSTILVDVEEICDIVVLKET